MAQCIEAFWSVGATELSDSYAMKGLSLIWRNIIDVVVKPSPTTRNAMAQGAYYSGRAINIAKTTAPHAFSYPFTSYCNMPHGQAVAFTFPFFFELNLLASVDILQSRVNATFYAEKMQTLRTVLSVHIGEERKTMENLIRSIGLRPSDRQAESLRCADLHQMLAGVNMQRLGNNPVIVDQQAVSNLHTYLASVISRL